MVVGKFPKQYLNQVKTHFDKDYVGYVNGYLRYAIPHFNNVSKIGIVYRDPREVMVSIANRKPRTQWNAFAKELDRYCIFFIDKLQTNDNYIKIDFKTMTSDPIYLEDKIREMGINDVEIKEENVLAKVNQTKRKSIKTFSDLPDNIKQMIGKKEYYDISIR